MTFSFVRVLSLNVNCFGVGFPTINLEFYSGFEGWREGGEWERAL